MQSVKYIFLITEHRFAILTFPMTVCETNDYIACSWLNRVCLTNA